MDSTVYNGLQTMSAAQAYQKGINLDVTDGTRVTNVDFQKMMEQVKSGKPDTRMEERPKTEKTTAAKKNDAQQEDEDPVETSKRLQVYLVPVSPETLAQYPASWLPQNLQEGEPVVCIGVRTGENGEDIPILVGANEAAQRFGREIVAPMQTIDVSDPEADAILEATAPGADNSPAAMLERIVAEQTGQDVEKVVEELQPQQENDDQVELIDVEQAPQHLFHDVEAAPVKVGETENPAQAEEPNVAQQVDAQLIQAMQRGESMVRIQLTPENLGTVTVEISQNADGVLRIALSAHNSETRGLLERNAANLQGLVSSRTQQTVEVNVQRGQESQQNQNQNYDGHNGHAHDGQERRRQQHEHTSPQDFMQQLRLGLIPTDGES